MEVEEPERHLQEGGKKGEGKMQEWAQDVNPTHLNPFMEVRATNTNRTASDEQGGGEEDAITSYASFEAGASKEMVAFHKPIPTDEM